MPLGLLKMALRTPAGLCLGGCGISCIGNLKKILVLFFTWSGFDHAVCYTFEGGVFSTVAMALVPSKKVYFFVLLL